MLISNQIPIQIFVMGESLKRKKEDHAAVSSKIVLGRSYKWLGFGKVKCDLEISLLLSPLMRPFNLSQRFLFLMCEDVILSW